MSDPDSSPSPVLRPHSSGMSPWPPRWVVILAAGVGLLIALTIMRLPRQQAQSGEGIGKPLTKCQLQPLTGATRPLDKPDLAGHVVLLNFWGTWCPPCRAEFPHLVDLMQRFKNQADFLPVLVSCGGGGREDMDELRTETRDFLAENHYDVPTYADADVTTRRALAQIAAMRGYPFTVILDRQSIIRGVWEGYDTDGPRQMADLVEELLHEK